MPGSPPKMVRHARMRQDDAAARPRPHNRRQRSPSGAIGRPKRSKNPSVTPKLVTCRAPASVRIVSSQALDRAPTRRLHRWSPQRAHFLRRDEADREPAVGHRRPHGVDVLVMRIRQRPQQRGVDDGEERRRRCDAQRQGEDGGRGKGGCRRSRRKATMQFAHDRESTAGNGASAQRRRRTRRMECRRMALGPALGLDRRLREQPDEVHRDGRSGQLRPAAAVPARWRRGCSRPACRGDRSRGLRGRTRVHRASRPRRRHSIVSILGYAIGQRRALERPLHDAVLGNARESVAAIEPGRIQVGA